MRGACADQTKCTVARAPRTSRGHAAHVRDSIRHGRIDASETGLGARPVEKTFHRPVSAGSPAPCAVMQPGAENAIIFLMRSHEMPKCRAVSAGSCPQPRPDELSSASPGRKPSGPSSHHKSQRCTTFTTLATFTPPPAGSARRYNDRPLHRWCRPPASAQIEDRGSCLPA